MPFQTGLTERAPRESGYAPGIEPSERTFCVVHLIHQPKSILTRMSKDGPSTKATKPPPNYPIIKVPQVKARGKGLDLLDYRRKSYAKKKGTQRVPLLNTTGRQENGCIKGSRGYRNTTRPKDTNQGKCCEQRKEKKSGQHN
jgi:hypothetical protein